MRTAQPYRAALGESHRYAVGTRVPEIADCYPAHFPLRNMYAMPTATGADRVR